jgi:hypothetical protein
MAEKLGTPDVASIIADQPAAAENKRKAELRQVINDPALPPAPTKAALILAGLGDVFTNVARARGTLPGLQPGRNLANLQEQQRERAAITRQAQRENAMLELQEILRTEHREDIQEQERTLATQKQGAAKELQTTRIEAEKDIVDAVNLSAEERAKWRNASNESIARIRAASDEATRGLDPRLQMMMWESSSKLSQGALDAAKTAIPDLREFARENDLSESEAVPALRSQFEQQVRSHMFLPPETQQEIINLYNTATAPIFERYFEGIEEKAARKAARQTRGTERAASLIGAEPESVAAFESLVKQTAPFGVPTGLGSLIELLGR